MRIVWSDAEQYFQAELTPGDFWRSDMETVKEAGFKTTGEPSWIWHASKAAVLNKLRKNRPESGLVLTEVALEKYKLLNQREEEKAAVKKQFEVAKKAAKKESKDPEISGLTELIIPEGKFWISQEDLPRWEPKCLVSKVTPMPFTDRCLICDDSLAFYEDRNVCMWCSKEIMK